MQIADVRCQMSDVRCQPSGLGGARAEPGPLAKPADLRAPSTTC